MANFQLAFDKVLQHEGSYVNDPNDPGGETYKGVSRKMWSSWAGWTNVDLARKTPGFPANLENDSDLQQKVKDFYQINYWDKMNGNNIAADEVAGSIFDFAVNAGVQTTVSLVQMVIGANADGVIGDETLQKLNAFDVDHFLASFIAAKIARYVNIVRKRPASQKYFFGWVCRALGEN